MSEQPPKKDEKSRSSFSKMVGSKAQRKLKARKNAARGVWFGMGMMGLIGWSVILPTLAGAALGFWLDSRFESKYSWTLSLIVAGLFIGCVIAWHWVSKEYKEICAEEEQEQNDDE